MIHGGGQPTRRGVTLAAFLAQAALVRVILGVASEAVLGGAFEDTVDVAGGTVRRLVLADQWERGQVMIHRGWCPAIWGVALAAVLAQSTLVTVVFGVASKTILWSALENAVGVAGGTIHSSVLANQFERGQVVVDGSRCPAVRGVTLTAVLAQATLVSVVFGMAGCAVLGGVLQRGQSGGCIRGVALPAGYRGMFSGERKSDPGMIEGMAIAVDAVMTGQAVLAKAGYVALGKRPIDNTVTRAAYRRIKAGIAVGMAARTLEGRAVGHFGMGFEGEAQLIVRKVLRIELGQGCVWPAVVSVAGRAAAFFSLSSHDIVKVVGVGLEIGVAGQAAVAHRLTAEGSRMTLGAFLDGGVGFHATQRKAAVLGVKRPWAEQDASAQQGDAGIDDDNDQGGGNGAVAETTEAGGFMHSSP